MTVENNQFECGIWDREGSCLIPLALLETLPVYQRKTIPSDYQDIMGHMNIHLMDWMTITFEAEILVSSL
jgi:hypothetical protein